METHRGGLSGVTTLSGVSHDDKLLSAPEEPGWPRRIIVTTRRYGLGNIGPGINIIPVCFFPEKRGNSGGKRYSIITALRVGQRFEYRVLLHTRYIIGSRLTP